MKLHSLFEMKQFEVTAWVEVKNRGGEGLDSDKDHTFKIEATSAEDAKAKGKQRYPKAYSVEVRELK